MPEILLTGTGIGFRRDLAADLLSLEGNKPDFIEFAPENWMGIGGFFRRQLETAFSAYPVVCHGLSLSIGSPDPLDMVFLKQLKTFFSDFPVVMYSEHLSFSQCDNGHLFELLPIPFREDAVRHIVERIKIVQDVLERPLILENASYYASVAPEMEESVFIRSIIEESRCRMLLDVNNVFVNAFNHGYDAKAFISRLPLDKISYLHMAGHQQVRDDLIIDTHGSSVADPVFDLLDYTLSLTGNLPVLLERDFNIPDWADLSNELNQITAIQKKSEEQTHVIR